MADESVENPYDAFQKLYEGHSTIELIAAMARVRKQKDDLESEVSGIGKELDYLSKVLIPDRFMEEGIRNMNVEGIGRVGLRADIYASIKSGAKDQAYSWLGDIGSGDLIQPGIPPSTLKAFLKARLKAGEDIPEDLFNVTPYQMAMITKT